MFQGGTWGQMLANRNPRVLGRKPGTVTTV